MEGPSQDIWKDRKLDRARGFAGTEDQLRRARRSARRRKSVMRSGAPFLVGGGLIAAIGLVATGRLDLPGTGPSTLPTGVAAETEPGSGEPVPPGSVAGGGSTSSPSTPVPAGGDSGVGGGGAPAIPDPADLPQGEAADQLALRIETAPPEAEGGATATVKADGRVHFEGAFRSREEADRYVARAREVFGDDAVVESYSIDPTAPAPSAGDVALDKPVLFEADSAEIRSEYIPFLEACGDVLKLNPGIIMSVSAYTDSSGGADYNLELSQRRAQAIVDFYADYQVDQAQLVGTGFGEDEPAHDNSTLEGREQNRRAMLQLLEVIDD